MLEGYLSGLEKNDIRFISENHENFRIILDEEHFFCLQHERIEKILLRGIFLIIAILKCLVVFIMEKVFRVKDMFIRVATIRQMILHNLIEFCLLENP